MNIWLQLEYQPLIAYFQSRGAFCQLHALCCCNVLDTLAIPLKPSIHTFADEQQASLHAQRLSRGAGTLKLALLLPGEWVPRGPKVHGRKYQKMEEWKGVWLASVSNEQQDTLNAELQVLPDTTGAAGLQGSLRGGNENATVRSSAASHCSSRVATHRY